MRARTRNTELTPHLMPIEVRTPRALSSSATACNFITPLAPISAMMGAICVRRLSPHASGARDAALAKVDRWSFVAPRRRLSWRGATALARRCSSASEQPPARVAVRPLGTGVLDLLT
jgi:hypothetical protein